MFSTSRHTVAVTALLASLCFISPVMAMDNFNNMMYSVEKDCWNLIEEKTNNNPFEPQRPSYQQQRNPKGPTKSNQNLSSANLFSKKQKKRIRKNRQTTPRTPVSPNKNRGTFVIKKHDLTSQNNTPKIDISDLYANQKNQFYYPKEPRRINLRQFGRQSGISTFYKREPENELFSNNILYSALFFAGKDPKKYIKLVNLFDKGKLKLSNPKYIQRFYTNMPVTFPNGQICNIPTTFSTDVLSKLLGRGRWILTPLDKNGKAVHPEPLVRLMLYNMYNYKDIQFSGSVSASIRLLENSKNKKNSMENLLNKLGFIEKKSTIKNRKHFELSKKKFLEICEAHDVTLE